MKATIKAILASVVVIALALSAISGITYSWWSAEESAQVDIVTGGLSVEPTDFTIAHGDTRYVFKDILPLSYSIKYGGTAKADLDLEEKGLDPDNLGVTISYDVKYSATLDARYVSDVTIPAGVTADVKIVDKDNESRTINPGHYVNMDFIGEKVVDDLTVTITLSKIDQNVSGSFLFTNYITQQKNADAISGEEQVEDKSATIGKTDAVYVKAESLPTDASKFKATVMTDDSSDKATINLSLFKADGTKISTFTAPVKITAVLGGKYDTLYYNGAGDQPQATTLDYNQTTDKTTVVFTTTHFSEFVACLDTVAVSTADEFQSALTGNEKTITLLDDIEIGTAGTGLEMSNNSKIIDLNNRILKFYNVYLKESAQLTIMHGYIFATKSIEVGCGSTLVLNDVKYEADGSKAIKLWGPNATVDVQDSLVAGKNIGIMTDASTQQGKAMYYGANINIVDSFITADDKSGDTTAVIINVDGQLNISDSLLKADRQCLVVRAGSALVENTEFIYTNAYDGSDKEYESSWADGNRLSRAAVVVGNMTSKSYATDATLTLKDCTYEYEKEVGEYEPTGVARALVIAQDSANGKSATVTLDSECKESFKDSIYSMVKGGNYNKQEFSGDTFTLTLPQSANE